MLLVVLILVMGVFTLGYAFRKRLPFRWLLGAAALGIAFLLMPFSPVGNVLATIMDPVYIIPKESSVWTFHPTVMNSGSGDWWLYGEDSRHFYHFIGSEEVEYVVFPRQSAAGCEGFDPHHIDSWCADQLINISPGEVGRSR